MVAKETVYLINNEPSEYSFSFTERSLHSQGHAGKLKVEPMSGVLPANSRYIVHQQLLSTRAEQRGKGNGSAVPPPSKLLINIAPLIFGNLIFAPPPSPPESKTLKSLQSISTLNS